EEGDVGPRDAAEELRSEVVAHVAVVSGEPAADVDLRAPGIHRQSRQVEADGPSLGPADEDAGFGRGELDAGAGEERLALLLVHGEIARTDLEQSAVGAELGQAIEDRLARRHHELGSGRNANRPL